MKQVTHQDVFRQMEQWAPKQLAYDWDPVGLQVGNAADITKKIMVTLDVTEAVVEEAIEKGANLIIAHHPLLFKPLQHISFNTFKGKVIQKLIKGDITVYAAHTNLDIAKGGVNDLFTDALKLENVQHLVETGAESLCKLVVYVPNDYVDQMRDALAVKGAGHIGDYSHCTFQTEGTGTFKPLDGTNPFIGTHNEMEFVTEKKLETIIKEQDIEAIISTIKRVHPYEEVAYDLYPVYQTGESYGLGRVGQLKEKITLEKFCTIVKSALDMDHLRYVGQAGKEIEKVAVLGGSGEKYIQAAIAKGADVYITGDVSFHPAQDALEMGLSIIDAGHYSEKIMKKATMHYLTTYFPELDIIVSSTNTDPFQFL